MGCGRPKHADCRLCVPVECVAAPALTRIRACDHLPNMAKPGCSAHFTERRVGARYAKLDGYERFRLQTHQQALATAVARPVKTASNLPYGFNHPGVLDIRGRRDFSRFDPFPREAPL